MLTKVLGPIIITLLIVTGLYFLITRGGEDKINTMQTQTNPNQDNVSDNVNQPDAETPQQDNIFPESNSAPYFYATLGGDWVKINENWSIRLIEVISDTRCPFGVACETSGKARVNVQFMQPNVDYTGAYFEELAVEGLNRFPMPDGELKPTLLYPLKIDKKDAVTSEDIGFTITLADLRPYPNKEFHTDIPQIPFVALFQIED